MMSACVKFYHNRSLSVWELALKTWQPLQMTKTPKHTSGGKTDVKETASHPSIFLWFWKNLYKWLYNWEVLWALSLAEWGQAKMVGWAKMSWNFNTCWLRAEQWPAVLQELQDGVATAYLSEMTPVWLRYCFKESLSLKYYRLLHSYNYIFNVIIFSRYCVNWYSIQLFTINTMQTSLKF